MNLTENAIKVLKKDILRRMKRKSAGRPGGMFRRVARTVASADKEYVSEEELKSIEQEFYDMMVNLDFLPNSPTLMNAGRPWTVECMFCFAYRRYNGRNI